MSFANRLAPSVRLADMPLLDGRRSLSEIEAAKSLERTTTAGALSSILERRHAGR